MPEATRERPRITSWNGDKITISGLTKQEIEAIEGALNGVRWIRAVEGELEVREVYKPLPDPVDDPKLVEYWSKAEPGTEVQPVFKFDDLDEQHENAGQSIYVQSLQGYGNEETYRSNAAKFSGYGFIPLRSKRGGDGKYWEIWYLPGPWHAEGTLKEFLEGIKDEKLNNRETTKRMISFLCNHGSFGTLDASVQRAALVVDD